MEFIRPDINIDFMGKSRYFIIGSIVAFAIALVLLFAVGFDSGIDFKGGTKIIAEFKGDTAVDRDAIKKVVEQLVREQTEKKGTQVEVQDFDVGGADEHGTAKYQIFTELPSLLTPIKKLELGKDLEKHFGKGTMVESPHEAGDKFYVTLPDDWPLTNARDEITKAFAKKDFKHLKIRSDKEQRIWADMLREKDLLLSARDDEVKAEAAKVETEAKAKIEKLSDKRFTVEVQAIKDQLAESMKASFGDGFVDIISTASVSPSVGEELFLTAILAMFYAIIGILIYISLRFDMKFAPGAIACLVHDVIIVFGLMVIFQIKFTLPIVAAIMTLIGYDINDTIIVYDRIRENIQKGRSGDLKTVINISINETLSRTIVTSLTTEFAVLSIWLLGGGTIKDFGFVLFIGIILGTYSSIFIASPLTIYFERVYRRRAAIARS